MIVFWAYDLYPFCLSAELVEVIPSGGVKVKGYGNSIFRPLIILPDEQGKPIAEELDRLSKEYEQRRLQLQAEYKEKAHKVAPWLS